MINNLILCIILIVMRFFSKTDYIVIPIFNFVLGLVTVLVDLINILPDPSANATLKAAIKAIAVIVLSSFYVYIRDLFESTIVGDGDGDPERESLVDRNTRYVCIKLLVGLLIK